MKSAINLGICILLLIFTVEIVQAVENRSIREEEVRQAVTSAVYTALEMTITDQEYRTEKDGEDIDIKEEKLNTKMKECFLASLEVLINSDSKINITILEADYKRGILDVEAEVEFQYSNGKKGEIFYRKTGILEQISPI